MAPPPPIKADLKLRNFQRYANALKSPEFKKLLEKHVGKATLRNGLLTEKAIRTSIKSNVPPALHPLTVFVKRSRKSLVDRGDLWKEITTRQESWDRAFVGVLKMRGIYNIAVALHNGVTIKVTPAMRAMFLLLFWASKGSLDPGKLRGRARELWERRPTKDWRPLAPGTAYIRIPPRPFMKKAITQELIDQIKKNWADAVQKAINEAASKGR